MTHNKMKQLLNIIVVIIFLAILPSCEIDDICVEDISTPKLVIEFFDAENVTDTKEVDTLSVWIEGKEKLYDSVITDSIAIPLNLNSNNTKYFLSKSDTLDFLHVYHTNSEVFVSRSCGFKMNFTIENNTQISNLWIDDFEISETPQIIENEQDVHVKIYH